MSLLAALPLTYAQSTWVGDTSQDWSNAANWSSDPANPTGNFTVNTATGNYPIVSTTPGFTPVDIFIGAGAAASGRVDVTGGTLSTGTGNWLIMGNNGGTGTLNVTGGSLSAQDIHIARTANTGTATVNVGGTGVINTLGAIVLGDGDSADDTAVGTFNVNAGGTVNCEADLVMGFAGNASTVGTLNIATGGVFNVASATKRWLIMSTWDSTSGVINVNGGALNLNANTDIQFSVGNWGPGASNGTSSINLNSGSVTMGAGSVINLNNNADRAVTHTINLNGGVFTVGSIISTKATGARVVNFHGGTLKAAGDSATFIGATAVSAANVKAGGAIIDTNGFSVTVAKALTADTVSTGGGLTKQGEGTLTLGGVNTYTGNTTINAGTLTLAANASLKFAIGANGASNKITGSGALTIDGNFEFDLASAATVQGNSWQVVDNSTLTETYGPTFAVTGFTVSGAKWVKPANGTFYEFDPATGILRVIADPGISYPDPTASAGTYSTAYPIGSDFVLSVTASGLGNLTYQWYVDTGSGRQPISGATAATLTISAATAANGGIYSVDVFDDAAVSSGQAPKSTTVTFSTISVLPGSSFSVAYYRFEEGTNAGAISSATDSTGTNHLTALGAPTYTSASVPYTTIPATGLANTLGANFPGTGNNGLIAPTSGTLADESFGNFTVEAFVRLSSLAGWQTIVGRDDTTPGVGNGDQALFYLSKAGGVVGSGSNNAFRIELFTKDNTNVQVNSNFVPVVGTWYHVAAVGNANAGTLKLYVNGTEVGSTTGFTGLMDPAAGSDTPWTVGRGDYGVADVDFFRGDIDEVRFSRAALPPSQFLNSANGIAVVNPSVSVSPTAQTIATGSSVTIAATAASNMGGTVSYQWYKDGNPLSGQTSSTLMVSGSSTSDSGVYSVTVTDSKSTDVGYAVTASGTSSIRVISGTAAGARTIGLNFVGAATDTGWSTVIGSIEPTTAAGFYSSLNWNNSATVTGVANQATPLALVENSGSGSAGATATWVSGGTWAARAVTGAPAVKSEHGKLLHGYIESRAATGANVSVSNIPYGTYDVYVYVTGGNNGGANVGSVSLNRESSPTYYFRLLQNDSTTVAATPTAEAPYAPAPMIGDATDVAGANAAPRATFVRFTGVTGSDLTITAKDAVLNANAGGIAAIQIVDTTPSNAAYPPVVTTAPVSKLVKGGSSVSLVAAATSQNSGTLSYQWQKDGVNLSGQTASTLTLNAVTGASSGNYTVIVTDTSAKGVITTSRTASLVVVDGTRSVLINGDINTAASATYTGEGILRADGTEAYSGFEPSTTVWNGVLGAAGSATRTLSKESSGLALSGVTFSYAGADGAEDNSDALSGITGTEAESLERDYLFANYTATPPATPFTATVGGLQALAGKKVLLHVYAVGKTTKTFGRANDATVTTNDTAFVSLATPNNHLNSPAGKTSIYGVNSFADAGRNIELNNPQASTANFGVTTSSYVAFTGVVSAEGTVSWTLSPDTTDAGKGLVPLVGFQLLVTGEDIAPAAPTNLVATAGSGQVGLSWTASSGATSYSVRRSTTTGTGYALLASGLNTTSYTDTNVTAGTTYYYVVTASKSSPPAESGYSTEASATPGSSATALQNWRQANFGTTSNTGNAANTADPDADGQSNLLEYALGTNPNTAGTLPVTVARSGNALTLSFSRIADATLVYKIEASNDLTSWTTAHTYTEPFPGAGTTTYTDTVSLTAQARRFLRLVVTAP